MSVAAAELGTTATTSATSSPAFDPKEVTVIFVLGGPGAGKGTQCARLVQHHGFVHLSARHSNHFRLSSLHPAGDLLRAEQQREGSQFGAMIKEYITEGKIVPMEVTIKLLENAMRAAMSSEAGEAKEAGANGGVKGIPARRFLIDGFPRQMDQAVKFDETVCPSSLVLFLVCPEPILLERLLERGKTSGRDDDNAESIKKRFQTFVNTSMPVVDYYRKQAKVVDIDSSKSIEEVYADIEKGIAPVLRA
ncbi:P-loop containing nucleoside triphosphate hydrolase protein [Rhodotorula toruloides]|uniref:Uridylate kinase n=1 Tax=Rhodotorula toruloides TaxID=5286 RepID=A0A2T0ADU5_RHOTO|nr:P-loop containing nucleoside triphosphate hydrolase protein [Rhodotorula toruloides]